VYGIIFLLHILAATVWTGGHLVLALTILPPALRQRSISELQWFESAYEKIGIPALIVQVVTGMWLAHRLLPDVVEWFNFYNPIARPIAIKLLLLFTTVAFALDARIRVIPKLTEERLTSLAWHIIPVTLVSVLFIIVGVSFRTGWLF